ncbi:MAG: metal ABC transporter solute-binding protein, Zn/Mn family [Desulfatiglandales bacterium]
MSTPVKVVLVNVFLGLLSILWAQSSFCGDPPKVLVSIGPQKFYVGSIGEIDPMVLIPSGYDPHTFEPKPSQLKEISRIDLYLTIGLPEEGEWIKKIKGINPKIKVVGTSPYGEERKAHGGQKGIGAGHHHHHDPHTWLSPKLGEEIAKKTFEALKEADPERSSKYEANLIKCLQTLRAFRAEIRDRLQRCNKKAFLVYHPAYGLFAEEFGLIQLAVEKEGKEPKAKDLAQIQEEIVKYGIKRMIVQPGAGAGKQRAFAERLGLIAVPVDPIAENWTDQIKKLIESMCD